jgi:hypothetical protein
MNNDNFEIIDVPEVSGRHLLKEEMGCWPGRTENCTNPREWAVFHSEEEAKLWFDYLSSVYIGTCSQHLPLALQRHPSALNFIRPYCVQGENKNESEPK